MFKKKKKAQTEEAIDFVTVEDDDTTSDASDIETVSEDADSKPPKKKLPSWAIWPIIGGLLVIIFAASFLGKNQKKSEASSLRVVEVTTGDIRQVFNASGIIESENTKTYYSPVTAPISNCNAEVGQLVKSGDLLITFDTTNLERDNQQAQLTLQSSYNSSRSSREQNAKAIAQAQEALAKANSALAEQANALAAQVDDIGAQLSKAESAYQSSKEKHNKPENLNRIAELQAQITVLNNQIADYTATIQFTETNYGGNRAIYDAAKDREKNGTSEPGDAAIIDAFQKYDAAAAALPDAQKQLADAQAELTQRDTIDEAGYQKLSEQYNAAYTQWQAAYNAALNGSGESSDVGMTSSELENLDISDNIAELTALTPEELLQKGREGMKADMDGVIASVETLTTNSAVQGGAVFSIASTKDVRVAIEISPDDYYRVKEGTAVDITAGEYKYKGTISRINKIAIKNAKGNPAVGVQIHINDPDENICIGASAKVSMTIAQSDNVLVVPTEAINASTDGNFVFVIEDGIVRKKNVELGTASTTQVEIKSGLKKGDKVVDELNVDVSEGMKATAVEPSSDSKDEKK